MMRTHMSTLLLILIATCGGTYRGCQTTSAKKLEFHQEESRKLDIEQREIGNPNTIRKSLHDDADQGQYRLELDGGD
jgi:hypothetical protein